MADEKSELAIVIEAINNASKTIKQVEDDLNGLNKEVSDQEKKSKSASGGFNSLVGAFVKGNLIVRGLEFSFGLVKKAVDALNQTMFESVEVAANYETTMAGLVSVANSFGHSADEATEAAKRLSEDGLLTPAQSAEALKNILAGLSGATVEQAESMVNAMKDTASFNRVLYDYGDAIINTTRGIRNRNSILTDSAGVQKNLSIIMQEAGFEIQDLDSSSKKYAATQALINGYLGESAFAYGDAEKYLDSYKGKQTSLNAILLETKQSLGEALIPAFEEFKDLQSGIASDIAVFLEDNKGKIASLARTVGVEMKSVVTETINFFVRNKDIIEKMVNVSVQQLNVFVAAIRQTINYFQILGGGIEFVVRSAAQASKVLSNMVKGDFNGVNQAYDEWLQKSGEIQEGILRNFKDMENARSNYVKGVTFDLSDWWDSVTSENKEGRDQMVNDTQKANEQISESDKKMLSDLEKENKKYLKELEKRTKSFEESFEDLVLSHRDAIQQLTEDLEEEKISYEKSLSGLGSDYDEAMADIKKSHADKTESIIEDMEEERKRSEEEIEKITEAYNAEVGLIEKEGQARLNNLKTQLAREEALGAMADSEKVASLKAMIAYEEKGLADSLAGRKSVYDEEVSDVEEKLNSELEKIKEGLEEENLVYEEALAERKTQYEEDVASLKESYTEKKETIQEELDEELLIREKYSEDFARLADKVADDDITRLVNKFNEEKDEMQREHEERLAEIGASAVESGEQLINGFNEGFDSAYPTFKQRVSQMESDIDNVLSKSSGLATIVGANAGINYSSSFRGGGGGGGGGGGAYAEGGLATRPSLVGEAGPEIVLPLSFPKRMADIMKNMGLSDKTRGNVVQNFYVTVKKEADVDMIMERASFAMKSGGGQR